MSYLQETEKNTKEGLSYVNLSSGAYKDTGNPARLLSEDEKQLLMRDIKIGHEYFVKLVSQNRNLSIETVRKLADGSSMMGEAALKNGLIDKIGIYPDVVNFLSEKIGTTVDICWKN
jgi:protease-4